MNLFTEYQQLIQNCLIKIQKDNKIDLPENLKGLTVELPPKNQTADISCNAAMILAKSNNKTPENIAIILKEQFLIYFKEFEKIEIAKPGFININFKSDFWKNYLIKLTDYTKNYGSNKKIKLKYNIEFVSANPTGPLHVGHARGAVLGDAISNLLMFNGHLVTKEYYVNDYGNQINNFVRSVYLRIVEINDRKKFPDGKDLYPGDYIIDIAKKIIQDMKVTDFSNYKKIFNDLASESLKISIQIIKNNLASLGVKHDKFVYESELIKKNLVSEVVKELEKNNFIYKGKLKPPKGEPNKKWIPREQVLFKSTNFGDDMDRSLTKEDGTWTYFAGDIAYHHHKIKRDFDMLINILGADHAGYIKRLESSVKALSNSKTNFKCKVSQLVKLYKKGQPFKMSKRKGDYITVEDLIKEVGVDSVRFMMLSRSNDVELDFDFEKVTEKSKDNPVFYIQYAYARINSVFRLVNINLEEKININEKDLIFNNHEIEILKKISEWPKCVDISLSKLEPHRISYYLYDLVTLFHAYWNLGKDKNEFKFIQKSENIQKTRLILLQSLSIVIKNGMSILGVSTPKIM
jgi:arginyl-tRNA synthetase